MTIVRSEMTINAVSVTEFKAHCLDVIRQVEQAGTAVDLTRHGKVVARLVPTPTATRGVAPWLRLRDRGRLAGAPETSVVDAAEFDALR
jgi:prevent-host-death family protein